ncbi:MAG: Ig-like domain-containing protein [Prevotella sp.]|jgi:hypothetical protein|nr:Ig-like domain-containing protein [Prevotella sp.]
MKKIFIVLLGAVGLLSACSEDDAQGQKDVQEINIVGVSNDTIKIDKSDTYQLNITTTPANAAGAVKYVSSNSRIFTISETGFITANASGVGSVTIIAPNGDSWTKVKCFVEVFEYVDSIAVNTAGLVLAKDETKDLSTLFTAYPVTASNRDMIYKSSDPSIVSIDEKGICKSVSKGIVEITATPADGKNDVVSKPVKIFSQYSTVPLDRKDWTAVANSTQGGYSLSNLFDGKTGTDWEAKWSENPPFWILIDTHKLSEFHQVKFIQSSYREAKNIEVYTTPVTTDGITADDNSFKKIGSVFFNDNTDSRILTLLPELQKSRYVKVVFLDSRAGNYISLAEIYMYKVSE